MRRAVAFVALLQVASACTGGTVEPPATISVTITTATTTTAEPPTSSTTEAAEECTEHPDGYMTTRQGFICPPDLVRQLGVGDDVVFRGVYLPGVYRTRAFLVPLEFTRHVLGTAEGEQPVRLSLDWQDRSGGRLAPLGDEVTVFAADAAEGLDMDALTEDPCVGSAVVFEATVDGIMFDGADLMDFDCFVQPATIGIETGQGPFGPGDGVRILEGKVGGVSLVVLVWSQREGSFDSYLTDVAQPIIDSIRFLDE